VSWIANAYLVTLAALMAIGGRLGDIVGKRNAFLAGITVFAAASALCGLAGDATTLLAGRVLQGVGLATDYLVRSIGVTSRTASFTRGVTVRSVSMSVSPPLDSDPLVHKEDKQIKTPAKSTLVNSGTALDRMAAMRV
jgi:MFS family permease